MTRHNPNTKMAASALNTAPASTANDHKHDAAAKHLNYVDGGPCNITLRTGTQTISLAAHSPPTYGQQNNVRLGDG
ncbi:unnamed protein product, partial [Iphiclides podalirius]